MLVVDEANKIMEGLTRVSCKYCGEHLSLGDVVLHDCFSSRITPQDMAIVLEHLQKDM